MREREKEKEREIVRVIVRVREREEVAKFNQCLNKNESKCDALFAIG